MRLESGADLLIINRFGKRESAGQGLAYLIERALDADIPVVIAVSAHRFADWIKFAGWDERQTPLRPSRLGCVVAWRLDARWRRARSASNGL